MLSGLPVLVVAVEQASAFVSPVVQQIKKLGSFFGSGN
jgi:hypothetical protein